MTKLVRNYRSAGALLKLPSEVSYGGELVECADKAVSGSMGAWSQLVTQAFPLLFYGCTSGHTLYKVDATSAHPSSSYRNVTEAEKLIELLESLLAMDVDASRFAPSDGADEGEGEGDGDGDGDGDGGSGEGGDAAGCCREAEEGAECKLAAATAEDGATDEATAPRALPPSQRRVTTNDIGVVTPFRAQVLHLRDMLRKRGLGAIRVGTVDDYQGQEELVIVISTVVGSANPRSVGTMAHGLMSSPQRFNVAITRAKALLVIVGDPNALWEDVSWRKLLQYAVDNRSYRGCAHPLMPTGAEESAIDAMAMLISQAAQRTLLGSGNASLMFPGLLGPGSAWGELLDDIDEEQGWKQF